MEKEFLLSLIFFNFIFSQQVIEHVKDNLLNSYISEEKRTLRTNGIVLHQIFS